MEPKSVDELTSYILAGVGEWSADSGRPPTLDELTGSLMSVMTEAYAAQWQAAKAAERVGVLHKASIMSTTLDAWVSAQLQEIEHKMS